MKQHLTLWERWNAPTPAFFVHISFIMLVMQVLALVIIAFFTAMGLPNLPFCEVILLVACGVALMGLPIGVLCSLAVDWKAYADNEGYNLFYFKKKCSPPDGLKRSVGRPRKVIG